MISCRETGILRQEIVSALRRQLAWAHFKQIIYIG
jgi:hypothetical protein